MCWVVVCGVVEHVLCGVPLRGMLRLCSLMYVHLGGGDSHIHIPRLVSPPALHVLDAASDFHVQMLCLDSVFRFRV